MTQIPRGPDHLVCPLHRSRMSKVCHACPLWVQLRGVNPNTGAEVDRWDCSLASLPMLLIENAQQARAAGAATESFRNEVVKRADAAQQAQRSFQHAQIAPPESEIIMIPAPRQVGGG